VQFTCYGLLYISAGSTVNICALDVRKAFDKMNQHGLFIKLMQRSIPINFLLLLERWFSMCITCIKWCNVWSSWYNLHCGIRQSGVLSPYFFAIYIDSLVNKLQSCGFGCYIKYKRVSILLYALLIAPTESSLQLLLSMCEEELESLDVSINVNKSSCIHVGPRHNVKCKSLSTSQGGEAIWTCTLRYLGVYIDASSSFSCSLYN